MENAPSFDKTIYKPLSPVPSSAEVESTWARTMELFDKGQFRDSLMAAIDYANPTIRKKFGNADQTEFNIPHGSAVIQMKISTTHFEVHAPFLSLPQDAKIPLLRRIAEINFGTLSLAQILLKGEELHFSFECPIELCYPYKVYETLREICSNADYLDDEFVDQFGARRIAEPVTIPMEASLAEQAWAKFQGYLAEAQQYIVWCESKRMEGFIWDFAGIQLRKIEYFMCPQGKLRNDIENAISALNNGNIAFNDRLSGARKFIAQLQSMTREQLAENLYTTEVFVPYKYYIRPDHIKNNFTRTFETATNEMNNKDYMGCTLTILSAYMDMFYQNNLTPDIAGFAEQQLTQAGGKPWKEAAELLLESVKKLSEKDLTQLLAGINLN
ncbi:MAG: hypothetical protein ACHQRM_15750 [Bacteroidia bacterium]